MSTSSKYQLWLPVAAITAGLLMAACASRQQSQPPTPDSIIEAAPDDTLIEPHRQEENPPVAERVLVTTDLEQHLIALYDQVNPSVVNVQLEGSQGTGFVIDSAGHIVTNYHVVGEAKNSRIKFPNGLVVEGEVIGGDPDSDLAVIKVDVPGEQLYPLPLADSSALRVGQTVVAIGNAFGLEGTMTTGIISALGRSIPSQATADTGFVFTIPNVIQTDAAINPGNSGGPLLNLSGEVVGVNTAIRSPVMGSAGVGFAVPSNLVKRTVPSLIAEGDYLYPWIGADGFGLVPELRDALGLDPLQQGILIIAVSDGSPAAEAGLRASVLAKGLGGRSIPVGGDVILTINGTGVTDSDDLQAYLVEHTEVGQTIILGVLRDGDTIQIEVTLGARPHET